MNLGVQVHELDHNLGANHAAYNDDGTNEMFIMGAIPLQVNGPLRCFVSRASYLHIGSTVHSDRLHCSLKLVAVYELTLQLVQ